MDEIEQTDRSADVLGVRQNLQELITKLEESIIKAQQILDLSFADQEPLYLPVTPEEANERKRELVFLKKDLLQKKQDLNNLDKY